MFRLSCVLAGLLLAGTASLSVAAPPGEVLYNGIRLPDQWPPKRVLSRKPMPVPYLEHRPAVIPIDVGRQLFVDDFLIHKTTLNRTFHTAEMYPHNPVVPRDKPWETNHVMPFSDGVWYDPAARIFKMWYMCGSATCYATSADAIHWKKPNLDVVPGTNIVRPDYRDSDSIWLDLEEKDPAKRYKMLVFGPYKREYSITLHVSADGIHWSEPVGKGRTYLLPNYDRTTLFYNPFRKLWVYNVRGSNVGPKAFPELDSSVGRVRYYLETRDFNRGWESKDELVPWVGVDERDLPDPEIQLPTQLYDMEAFPYESLMVGQFAVWRGPDNDEVKDRGKRNEIYLGFSRDGFHWDRSDDRRRPFIPVSDKRGDWNWGNAQPVGGGALVMGDKLYFYFSARRGNPESTGAGHPDGTGRTGIAILRRDGFASMDTTDSGSLETALVQFSGKHLLVNAVADEVKVEVLDRQGRVISPFSRAHCEPFRGDRTMQAVRWKGASDLSKVAGQAVRFRFLVRKGSLYSFWVSASPTGASNGYVAAGGPGFLSNKDAAGGAPAISH
ncbi:MAG: hypothetical protein ABIZ80_01925 [Bryobacteraceae bacterium]